MIDVEDVGGLRRVVINRPDKANSLTREMLVAVAEAAETAQGMNAFVLTGLGKVFSAGADLDAAKAGLAVDPVWERVSGAIADLPCLTLAALNGTLAGGAFGMALACDMRICVEGARFFYPVMKLGFLPQPSDPARLAALIGPARAKQILMGGARIDAGDALRIGLVEAVVARDALDAAAHEICTDALGAETAHVGGIKALF